MFLFNSDSVRESGQKVPLYIRLPLGIVIAGLIGYFMYTGSGPYLWATNLQTGLLDGDYYPIVSMAFTLIVVLTPALFVGWVLSKLFSKKNDSVEKGE